MAIADHKGHEDTKAVVPGFQLERIHGDYVHEPRVEGHTTSKMSEIKAAMKKAGYKAPAKWNKQESQTFHRPETGHQVTVKKGYGTRTPISSYPKYKLEHFDLD